MLFGGPPPSHLESLASARHNPLPFSFLCLHPLRCFIQHVPTLGSTSTNDRPLMTEWAGSDAPPHLLEQKQWVLYFCRYSLTHSHNMQASQERPDQRPLQHGPSRPTLTGPDPVQDRGSFPSCHLFPRCAPHSGGP